MGEAYTNHSLFRILNVNIGGLAAKLVSNDFIDYLNTFDLLCQTETFVDEGFEISALKEFIFFIAPAKKLSRQGRRSGGVVVCIRKCFAHLFRQVTVKFDNFIVLESSKALLNIDKDVLFIFVYIPPSGSPAVEDSLTADDTKGEDSPKILFVRSVFA